MSSTKWRFKENHKLLSSRSCMPSTKWWFKENHKPIKLTFHACLLLLGYRTSRLEALLSIVDVFPSCEGQGEKMQILSLQDASILENGLVGMTDIYS
jgi:hypothetical protein